MTDYTFRRGDIVWFNDPVDEMDGTYVLHGRHPAIVVSGDGANIHSDTVIIAPMTSNTAKRIYPGQFDVSFERLSRVRCDQLRVVDKHTLEQPVAKLDQDALSRLDSALTEALGIWCSSGFDTVSVV